MRPEPRYRLLVFDWDGTLMDSVGTIVACTRAVQAELGLDPLDPRLVRETIGLGLADVFARLYPTADEPLRRRVVESYRHHWLETYRRQLAPIEGAIAVLAELAAEGYALAVATGKSRPGLDRDLRETGLAGRFVATRTVSEAPSKPHPGMLRDLLEELGVRPGHALMIGDTTFDLEMAERAGVDSLAVLSGGHERPALEERAPRGILESVRELPGWLRRAG